MSDELQGRKDDIDLSEERDRLEDVRNRTLSVPTVPMGIQSREYGG